MTCFSFSLNAAMLLCDDWLSELCPMSDKIPIRGSSGNETSSHETALVTCFRALGHIN